MSSFRESPEISRLHGGKLQVVFLCFESQVLDTRGGALALRHSWRETLDGGGGGRREGGGGEGALVAEGGQGGNWEGG